MRDIFAIWLFLLIACSLGNASVPSVDEILQTNQYILVSQQDGYTFVETDIPFGECPQVFLKQKTNNPENIRYVGFHLVRDPLGSHPPRIMVIRRLQSSLNINLFAINTTRLFHGNGNSPSKMAVFVDNTASIGLERLYLKERNMQVNSLFDSTNRMLYLDFSTQGQLHYEQFYVRGLFDSNFTATLLSVGKRKTPIFRFDWTEDHYAGKFYYKENVDNEVSVFEIPMGSLVSSLLEGESGTKLGKLNSAGKLIGATGGAFFSVDNSSGENWGCTTSLVPASLGSGMQCVSRQTLQKFPAFFEMLVIRDHDYCMLRDGSNYNRENCDAERIEYMISKGMLTQSDGAVRWLLVICLILFMLVVLLFVYIYWLRSTFISEEDRSHHNEYETEASLFVAKQRSFPSVYQDPALMDVSVDKWN